MNTPSLSTNRVQSVDLLRGLVLVLMAIDHVRVYSGIPAGGPEAGVFFTRWVTHFCAPAFAFLAGTSAFLYGVKLNNKSTLARYLATRGLLLVVLEITLIRFLWAFHVSSEFFLAGVIWMLGWCMVLLAVFIWLSPRIVGVIGLIIILAQSVFSHVPYLLPESDQTVFAKLWEFIYPSGFESYEGVAVLYSIVPWIGVMAAGYGFGLVFTLSKDKIRNVCLAIGLTAVALFIIIGSMAIVQQPNEDGIPFIFQLLNQRKYPASPLFLAMTLGPIIALVPWAEKATGWFADALKTFGRVPFFYYLLHIPVIHLSALLVQWIKLGFMPHDWYKT